MILVVEAECCRTVRWQNIFSPQDTITQTENVNRIWNVFNREGIHTKIWCYLLKLFYVTWFSVYSNGGSLLMCIPRLADIPKFNTKNKKISSRASGFGRLDNFQYPQCQSDELFLKALALVWPGSVIIAHSPMHGHRLLAPFINKNQGTLTHRRQGRNVTGLGGLEWLATLARAVLACTCGDFALAGAARRPHAAGGAARPSHDIPHLMQEMAWHRCGRRPPVFMVIAALIGAARWPHVTAPPVNVSSVKYYRFTAEGSRVVMKPTHRRPCSHLRGRIDYNQTVGNNHSERSRKHLEYYFELFVVLRILTLQIKSQWLTDFSGIFSSDLFIND